MDEIKLKPCPFCGGEAKADLAKPFFFLKKWHNRLAFVGCTHCGASTGLFNANNRTGSKLMNEANENEAIARAINAWNRRVNDG